MLDVMLRREPFFNDSYSLLKKNEDDEVHAMLTVKSLMDIYYVCKRALHSEVKAREIIGEIVTMVEIVDSTGDDACSALPLSCKDYEDAVLMMSAKRANVDFIATRNIKDYKNSLVRALQPKDILNIETQ